MDLKQVQYFLSVTENGTFSAAAEGMHLSQSSLSKQIMALEKELDLQLFDRSKRRVSLTEAGKIFNKHAINLNDAYLAALTDLEVYRKTSPTLSIAAIPVIGQYGITPLVEQFKNAHPNINFILEEREVPTVLSALDNYLDTSQYASLDIFNDRLMVAVSNKHRFASRKSLFPAELADENFIIYKEGTIVHKLAVNACRSAGFEPKIFCATLRGASIIGLVASNSGVALMMEKVLDYYERPDVISIPLDEAVESNIVIAYLKNKKLSKPAKTFIEFMGKYGNSIER